VPRGRKVVEGKDSKYRQDLSPGIRIAMLTILAVLYVGRNLKG